MHKRKRQDSPDREDSANPYVQERPHFGELAQQYPALRPFVYTDRSDRPHIDFKDPKAVRTLTWCLLKRDFDLDVKLRDDRLCPPVPNRLDYIIWIENILHETLSSDQFQNARGIDIGVGASCIYPLLGCVRHKDWKFDGTEINETSVRCARGNVDKNKLNDRITVRYNDNPERIFLLDKGESYTFCMCNPPFYASPDELEESLQNKQDLPFSVCTGTQNEMITDGGEYGFIERIMNESLIYKDRIQWYTSLIGLKKSVRPLVNQLKSFGITNYVVTEFIQGRTKRWAIAWSFGSKRVNKAKSLDEYRPKSQFVSIVPKPVSHVRQHLLTILDELNIAYEQDELDDDTFRGGPKANTWSRAARRQLAKKQKIEEQETPLFGFQIELLDQERTHCEITSLWVNGSNRDAFESFWNHIKKRIEEACGLERGTKSKLAKQ
ncbi:hypothetical protein BDA99DRAFT_526016 [Phascolomyces articulosus]|uniref:U6 small nuclear RNA (adenine-(43)-N(6))-methyltransferase n=1 Tax=Phascolomyces articulosus TaxID=60185 RepID=A0AAD5JNM7_9FUNG|nr:hypothetical protein BDA99DRAFT_526016 [Phascolomyces articulosus]